MKNLLSINHFENEKYRIKKVKDGFHDKFEINEINNLLILKRVDKNEGWGADLKLSIFNKITGEEYNKVVGNSDHNCKRIKLPDLESKNHFETNEYKLYTISEHNDLFKINYKDQQLKIKRIDASTGWGQKLIIEYFEKKTNKIKHIDIGPSKENKKIIEINIDKIKYKQIPNHYIDEKIEIHKLRNEYEDQFEFDIDLKTEIIKIKRIDSEEGWGQNLMIKINIEKKIFEFYIGSSASNIFFKKLCFLTPKIVVSLTTIPSRGAELLRNVKKFIKTQNQSIDTFFINIPKQYKRFKEKISPRIIEELQKIPKVVILNLENDVGPASKYLGPLENENMDQTLLIIIDDDRLYNYNLVRHFLIAYRSFPQYEFYAGLWNYFFNKKYKYLTNDFLEITIKQEKNIPNFQFGDGLGGFFGFCLKLENKEKFIRYHYDIFSRYKKSFFHDEGISMNYIKNNELPIVYLKQVGCLHYDKESVDALCLSGTCNRSNVEKDIYYITQNENLL